MTCDERICGRARDGRGLLGATRPSPGRLCSSSISPLSPLDRPLDVLRAAVVALHLAADGAQRLQLLIAQAGSAALRLGHRRRSRCRRRQPAHGECALSEISRTEISPVILPRTQRSGVTSPPTTAEPRPQAPSMVMTERSPVSRAAREHHSRGARIHHRLHHDRHGDAASGRAALAPIADRLHRVQARPAAAHLVAASGSGSCTHR